MSRWRLWYPKPSHRRRQRRPRGGWASGSSDGYDKMLELVAESTALEAGELVAMATVAGLDTDDIHEWLEDARAGGEIDPRTLDW